MILIVNQNQLGTLHLRHFVTYCISFLQILSFSPRFRTKKTTLLVNRVLFVNKIVLLLHVVFVDFAYCWKPIKPLTLFIAIVFFSTQVNKECINLSIV